MSEEAPQAGTGVPAGAISKDPLNINKRGLHARAPAKFVPAVERCGAQGWVTRGGGHHPAHDRGAADGIAAGTDAEAALAAITELVESKFNEEGV